MPQSSTWRRPFADSWSWNNSVKAEWNTSAGKHTHKHKNTKRPNIPSITLLSFLWQEIRLENLSFSISRGKAWRWQDEAQRVSLWHNQLPHLKRCYQQHCLTISFLSAFLHVFSYGIRNRDEVTFMKRLRKKWNIAANICHVRNKHQFFPFVPMLNALETWIDFHKILLILCLMFSVWGAALSWYLCTLCTPNTFPEPDFSNWAFSRIVYM